MNSFDEVSSNEKFVLHYSKEICNEKLSKYNLESQHNYIESLE